MESYRLLNIARHVLAAYGWILVAIGVGYSWIWGLLIAPAPGAFAWPRLYSALLGGLAQIGSGVLMVVLAGLVPVLVRIETNSRK